MRILFISPNLPDYLSDGLLHGLKSLTANQVIDFPKARFLYETFDQTQNLYGKGFSLYGLLPDLDLERHGIYEQVQQQLFDLVIFGDISRCFGSFVQLLPYLRFDNTIVLDGADSPQPFPYGGYWWRRPYYWFLPKAHTRFLYFKREWTKETMRNLYYQIPPLAVCDFLPTPANFRTIAFSIPQEKIIVDPAANLRNKQKLFPKHIVDAEVVTHVPESQTRYAFADEKAYYQDLQVSKFGITTKRSGWDCLRHYEIAANGAVPCFRDLDLKPVTCAPHGLDQTNSISYRNYDDLIAKIERLSDRDYEQLHAGALAWVRQNTTIARVKQILTEFSRTVSARGYQPPDIYV